MITMYKILLCLSLWIAHTRGQLGANIDDNDFNLLTETLVNLLSTAPSGAAGGSLPVTSQYGISSSPSSLSPPDQVDLTAYGSGAVSQQPQTIVYQQSHAKPAQRRVGGQSYGVYIIQPIPAQQQQQQPVIGYGQSAPEQSSIGGGYAMPVTSNYGVTIQVAPTYLPMTSGSQPSGYGESGYQQQQVQYPVQQTQYQAPQPSYQPPQPSYQAPQPSYQAPQPSYQPPQPSYQAQQPTYQAQQPSYQAQQPTYQAPQPTYQAPQPQYQAPQPQYQAPQLQYPAPQPQYSPKPQYSPPKYPPKHTGYPPKKPMGYGKPRRHYGYGKPKKRYYKKPELIEIPKGYVPDFDDLNPHEKHPVPHINKLFLA